MLFEPLQQQQGFAANLLGNLIPTNATAGLVGGTTQDTVTSPGRGIASAANVAQGKAGGGPTQGQASTTNVLLERILSQLRQLNTDSSHPEAKYERKAGSAIMDGIGGV